MDTDAASRYADGELYAGRKFKNGLRLFARPSYYGESRRNGTPLQFNRTHVRQLAAGSTWETPRSGRFGLRAHASPQVFDQSFTSVSADVNPWRLVTTDTWVPPRRDVFVRIGIVGDNGTGVDTIQLDDMVVQCQYF